MTLSLLPAVLGIMMLAYTVRGVTGAGSGLIAMPLLALILPIQLVVPSMLALDFTASVVMSRATWSEANWTEVKRLLPTGVIGVVVGTILLVGLPQKPLLLFLGIFIVIFGIRNLIVESTGKAISHRWAPVTGLLGGALGALFGTGGPPYMIYLSRRITDKAEFRATFSILFLIEGGTRVVAFMIAGLLLKADVFVLWGVGLVALAFGLWAGSKIHTSISNAQMLKAVGVLVIVSGISLLVKVGGMP